MKPKNLVRSFRYIMVIVSLFVTYEVLSFIAGAVGMSAIYQEAVAFNGAVLAALATDWLIGRNDFAIYKWLKKRRQIQTYKLIAIIYFVASVAVFGLLKAISTIGTPFTSTFMVVMSLCAAVVLTIGFFLSFPYDPTID